MIAAAGAAATSSKLLNWVSYYSWRDWCLRTRRKRNLLQHRDTDRTDREARLCMAERGPGLQTKPKEDEKIKIKLPLRQGMKGGSHHTNGDCTDASWVTPPKDFTNYHRRRMAFFHCLCHSHVFTANTLRRRRAGAGAGQGRAGRGRAGTDFRLRSAIQLEREREGSGQWRLGELIHLGWMKVSKSNGREGIVRKWAHPSTWPPPFLYIYGRFIISNDFVWVT